MDVWTYIKCSNRIRERKRFGKAFDTFIAKLLENIFIVDPEDYSSYENSI